MSEENKKIKKDEELSKDLYRVARGKGTEAPFTGKYWNEHGKGMYRCAICGSELFSSDTKFDSGTGWPSFTEPANLANVELKEDMSDSTLLPPARLAPQLEAGGSLRSGVGGQVRRTEVLCKKCGAHLGHVFDDLPRFAGKAGGPEEKGGKRYCINSVCLELEEKKK